jgi:hypothetical protein
MGGWKIEYVPVTGGSPVSTHEMDTLEIAVGRAIDRGWRRDVAVIVAIHGPSRSIRGDELRAILDDPRLAN